MIDTASKHHHIVWIQFWWNHMTHSHVIIVAHGLLFNLKIEINLSYCPTKHKVVSSCTTLHPKYTFWPNTLILKVFLNFFLDEQSGVSLDGRAKTEVKQHNLEQAFTQTIVFSLVQKQRHPDSLDHMVPNVVISPEKFEIVMYDADNDILLCSNSIFLFNLDLPENRTLTNEAVVVLWMVLHYRIFCSGFNNASHEVLERCKSNFKKLVGSRWDIYSNSLKYCVSGFPSIKKWSVNELLRRGHQLNLY